MRELKARKAELEETLAKVIPLRPPPYLYTEANIARFRAQLKDIFLSGKTQVTRNYLRFLVHEVIVTDDRIEVILNPRSALALMAAEGRKAESEALSDAPDSVLTTVVSWRRTRGT